MKRTLSWTQLRPAATCAAALVTASLVMAGCGGKGSGSDGGPNATPVTGNWTSTTPGFEGKLTFLLELEYIWEGTVPPGKINSTYTYSSGLVTMQKGFDGTLKKYRVAFPNNFKMTMTEQDAVPPVVLEFTKGM